jgi:anti-sigma factor ChrR (cupin superfamily)
MLFNGSIQQYDWLVVTHSKKRFDNVGRSVNVDFHSHPNAFELILFQKHGFLEISGKQCQFMPGDIVLIEPGDVHGAQNLTKHDCICILLGKGRPQKTLSRERVIRN